MTAVEAPSEPDRADRDGDDYERLFLDFLAHRKAAMGAEAGGLHDFYSRRLQLGRALNRYEAVLAGTLLHEIPRYDAYVEIGAGFGQLPFLLAVRGLRTIAIEKDDSRLAGLQSFRGEVARRWPQAEPLMAIVQGAFPCAVPGIDPERSLVLTTNLVHHPSPDQEQRVIDGIARFRAAVVDTAHFCRERLRDDEWAALDARFAAAGLSARRELWTFAAPGADYRERFVWYSR